MLNIIFYSNLPAYIKKTQYIAINAYVKEKESSQQPNFTLQGIRKRTN